MSVDDVINEIKNLPPQEIDKVGEFLKYLRKELTADQIAAQRDFEIEDGSVVTLSEEEVLENLKHRLS